MNFIYINYIKHNVRNIKVSIKNYSLIYNDVNFKINKSDIIHISHLNRSTKKFIHIRIIDITNIKFGADKSVTIHYNDTDFISVDVFHSDKRKYSIDKLLC